MNKKRTKPASIGSGLVGPPPRAISFEVGVEYLLTDGELPKTEAKRKAFMDNLELEIEEILEFAFKEKFGRRIVAGIAYGGSLTW